MRRSAFILAACACAVIALASPRQASAQEGGAGIVEEIRGAVFWRPNPGTQAQRLDPRADDGRLLYPGEQVRCARGSSLRLWLGREPRTVRTSAWFTIPPAAPSQSDSARRMLDDYGRVGGLDRGDESKIFSPSEHSVAAPGQFGIRWIPDAAGCTLSLTIRGVGGEKVWQREDVDGSSGSLIDAAAGQELVKYRARSGLGPLTLQADDSCAGESRVSFLLLSVKDEQSLEHDLSLWGKAAGTLLRHLGRASVYSRYGIFPQAAEEYESALKAAPNGRHLLLRTIKAHRRTGNFMRAQELEKLLPGGTNTP